MALDLTEHLTKNLTDHRYSFTALTEREIVLDVIEKPSYVGVVTTQSSNRLIRRRLCELPDGNIITAGANGCHDTSSQYIKKCDVDFRKMCMHVVPSGGTTIFRRMVERITNVLTALAPSTVKVQVVAPPE